MLKKKSCSMKFEFYIMFLAGCEAEIRLLPDSCKPGVFLLSDYSSACKRVDRITDKIWFSSVIGLLSACKHTQFTHLIRLCIKKQYNMVSHDIGPLKSGTTVLLVYFVCSNLFTNVRKMKHYNIQCNLRCFHVLRHYIFAISSIRALNSL